MTRDLDPEDIAVFVEGRLAGPDRERVVAHLASSDEDAELLADAAAVLRELEAEDGILDAGADGDDDAEDTEAPGVDAPGSGTPVVPLPPPSTARRGWRRAPARWLALAAVLAGVLLIPFALSRRGGDPGDPGRLVAMLEKREEGLPEDWDLRPWSVTRGAGDGLTDEARAARLGALLVDLELAVAGRQAEETSLLALRIRRHLEDVQTGNLYARTFEDIERRAGQDPAQLADLLRQGRTDLAALLLPDHFALGAWAEAAWIAAQREDTTFFASRESRRALDRAIDSPAMDPSVREAAERVRARMQAVQAGRPDWGALQADVGELLRAVA